MCGIAGFCGKGDRSHLEAMTQSLAHRGPDASGYSEDTSEGVYLGHRRLAIVDIGGGIQPMWTADGSAAVIFNGEIYNHRELRQELEQVGRRFLTDHSDTEVLLQAYLEWGDDFTSRLNGMWAFVIYDRMRHRLLGSRDRFGKKPFYYFENSAAFAWASELTALLRHPCAPRSVSLLARQKFFAYCCIPAPLTAIEGIKKLQGGHSFSFDLRSRHLKIWQYWDFVLEPHRPVESEDALAEELRHLLDAAVRRRLVADVPVGVFLSGGIDSSAIAALASRHVSRLQSFSIGFTEPSFDELPYANKVAALLGTKHDTEILDLTKACELLPDLVRRLDEPQGDSSLLPTWLLARFTRSHVTVALSGDGGDELFAGYDPFAALRAADLFFRFVPRTLHPAIRLFISNLLPVSHRNLSLDFKIKRTLRGLSYDRPLWCPIWLGALDPREIRNFFGTNISTEELYSEAICVWDSLKPSASLVDHTLQFFTKIYLQEDILPKVDRATMMNALEVRSPFLDVEVAEFARRLPDRFKLRGKVRKYILKKALKDVLPDDILNRPKKGFGMPIGRWFQTGALQISGGNFPGFAWDRQVLHRSLQSDEKLFLWCQWVWENWEKTTLPQ
jgi:asparagine synthase (glutamine-hydrolysing)